MKFLLVAAFVVFILVAIEVQIIGIHNQHRKDKCEIVIRNGIMYKASSYEYYSCLNGDK